ncbi:hypothetical protein FJT64_000989 [Amphibalanus amphitrite]|uniref:Uncharacterized protein n=1 Tax=Amphibalanus amphitrite TaxID=1232801 RepID=A0A6A4VFP6_AMPAM|nr:hypothetical protein FJT64_000989 [Amphibalanus amphitrite]
MIQVSVTLLQHPLPSGRPQQGARPFSPSVLPRPTACYRSNRAAFRHSGGVLVWRRVESERGLQPLPCQRVIPPQGQASKADLFIPPLDGSTIEHIVGTGSQLGPATLQASSSVGRCHGPPPSAAESVDSP